MCFEKPGPNVGALLSPSRPGQAGCWHQGTSLREVRKALRCTLTQSHTGCARACAHRWLQTCPSLTPVTWHSHHIEVSPKQRCVLAYSLPETSSHRRQFSLMVQSPFLFLRAGIFRTLGALDIFSCNCLVEQLVS